MTDSAEDFEPYVGSVFRTDGIHLHLTEVRRLGEQPGTPREHPFALVFTGPADAPLAQQIHGLTHDDLGELAIFLVPIGPGPDRLPRYEAVFN
jgi:hypothetical protein